MSKTIKVTRTRVANILADAATFIENHRWTKGTWVGEKGEVCAMGAVDSVIAKAFGYKSTYGGNLYTVGGSAAETLSSIVEMAANESVAKVKRPNGLKAESIIGLNDHQKVTDKRVIVRALRRAAKDVESGTVMVYREGEKLTAQKPREYVF